MSNAQDNGDQPGTRSYRPKLSPLTVTQLTRDLYGLHVVSCRELDSYDDRNFHVVVDASEVHNVHFPRVSSHGYVLKVLNSLDSKRPDVTGESWYGQRALSLCMVRQRRFAHAHALYLGNVDCRDLGGLRGD